MAVEHEIDALASRAEQQQLRRIYERAKRLSLFRTIAAYRTLFLDEHGAVRPDAVAVIADFSRVAKLGVVDASGVGDAELRERSGRRAIALHILGRLDLDGSKLRDLASKLRETGNE
ncbi:Bbp19 family protein [Sphingomonas alpina]|uniref:Bbp19-like phage domain-containing protein n=1 Tax=Sphingomonas alpina TaxID=653931 RepID=A0A7H0LHV0_9SPHN|nr:hypothetical protein [Sphingomonas alpina]QNQ09253.1 hypothetical protein H3Z74_21705 [Sphingomonas alpina]